MIKGEKKMTSKEALDIIKQRINTIRLNTKIGSRRIADEENAVLLDNIEHSLNKLCELVERDTPMLPIKLKWWENTESYYYVCPKCEEWVARTNEVFCQDCGQRLDWNFDFLETLKEEQKELENE